MKRNILRTGVLVLLAAGMTGANAQTPAFPGAEGHGRYTTGGRGGTVYHVTNLNDSGTGSLREALGKSGAKTIVFDVSGTIHLLSELKTQKDNLTIAGQTSPGGICIADYPFVINSNNVIIRYVSFRPGDASGTEPDGLSGMDKKNIIVDHCSVSWSVDECLSVYGMENSTVQWCIAGEALRHSVHDKGTHGYGGNWGGKNASYHHNLIAHCESRVPRLGPRYTTQTEELVDIRNNVFYNWRGEGCYGGEGQQVNIVNNYYKPGPATRYGTKETDAIRYRIAKIGVRTEAYAERYPSYAPMTHIWGKYFIDGNTVDGNEEVSNDNWTKGVYAQQSNGSAVDNLWTQKTQDTIRLSEELVCGYITTHSAADAYERVLDYVGNCLYRDEVDERIVSDTRTNTATYRGSVTGDAGYPGYINTPADTKPADAPADWTAWPELPTDESRAIKDTDGDGIPDEWETANGLNPNSKADGAQKTLSDEGYTNLEVYLNSLVEHITKAQNEGGVTSIEETTVQPQAQTRAYGHNGQLYLTNLEKGATVSVYSLTGTKMATARTEAEQASFVLQAGIYLVQVVWDGNAQSFKVLVD